MEWPTNFMELIGSLVTLAALTQIAAFLFRRIWLERYYNDHEGKVIVITGCDSGFGYDTAIRLINKGCYVVAGCFLESSLDKLKEAVGAHAAQRLETVRLNLEDDASVDAFVHHVKQFLSDEHKRLYGFVNNAGLFCAGPSEWMTRDTMRRIFNVNAIGAMELTNKMAPLLHKAGGRLVSLSSVSALVHGPQLALYGASKAALDNFQSSIRVETQRKFSVHLILPGGFRTPLLNPTLLKANIASNWEKTAPEVRHDYGPEYYNTFVQNWSEGVVRFANPNPGWVVDNVEHALFASYPRLRYYTGYDAIALFGWLSFAPTWLQDRVLRRANARFFRAADGKDVTMAIYENEFRPIENNNTDQITAA